MPPQCGREPLSLLPSHSVEQKPYLSRNPASFDGGGVALALYLSQKMGRSPNPKIKNKILEKSRVVPMCTP